MAGAKKFVTKRKNALNCLLLIEKEGALPLSLKSWQDILVPKVENVTSLDSVQVRKDIDTYETFLKGTRPVVIRTLSGEQDRMKALILKTLNAISEIIATVRGTEEFWRVKDSSFRITLEHVKTARVVFLSFKPVHDELLKRIFNNHPHVRFENGCVVRAFDHAMETILPEAVPLKNSNSLYQRKDFTLRPELPMIVEGTLEQIADTIASLSTTSKDIVNQLYDFPQRPNHSFFYPQYTKGYHEYKTIPEFDGKIQAKGADLVPLIININEVHQVAPPLNPNADLQNNKNIVLPVREVEENNDHLPPPTPPAEHPNNAEDNRVLEEQDDVPRTDVSILKDNENDLHPQLSIEDSVLPLGASDKRIPTTAQVPVLDLQGSNVQKGFRKEEKCTNCLEIIPKENEKEDLHSPYVQTADDTKETEFPEIEKEESTETFAELRANEEEGGSESEALGQGEIGDKHPLQDHENDLYPTSSQPENLNREENVRVNTHHDNSNNVARPQEVIDDYLSVTLPLSNNEVVNGEAHKDEANKDNQDFLTPQKEERDDNSLASPGKITQDGISPPKARDVVSDSEFEQKDYGDAGAEDLATIQKVNVNYILTPLEPEDLEGKLNAPLETNAKEGVVEVEALAKELTPNDLTPQQELGADLKGEENAHTSGSEKGVLESCVAQAEANEDNDAEDEKGIVEALLTPVEETEDAPNEEGKAEGGVANALEDDIIHPRLLQQRRENAIKIIPKEDKTTMIEILSTKEVIDHHFPLPIPKSDVNVPNEKAFTLYILPPGQTRLSAELLARQHDLQAELDLSQHQLPVYKILVSPILVDSLGHDHHFLVADKIFFPIKVASPGNHKLDYAVMSWDKKCQLIIKQHGLSSPLTSVGTPYYLCVKVGAMDHSVVRKLKIIIKNSHKRS